MITIKKMAEEMPGIVFLGIGKISSIVTFHDIPLLKINTFSLDAPHKMAPEI